MITKLTAQDLGKKVQLEEGVEGTLKAYNNVRKIAFVMIEGVMSKLEYGQLTLK